MDDGKVAAQALDDAHRILEEYLLPLPRVNVRAMLDRLVEVLARPDIFAVVTRLKRGEPLDANSRTTCTVIHWP